MNLYIIQKTRKFDNKIIGFLSANKKRWALRSCGIFDAVTSIEIVDFLNEHDGERYTFYKHKIN